MDKELFIITTLRIEKEVIQKIDKVRGLEARASYIRRAVVYFLSKEQLVVEAAATIPAAEAQR